MTTVSERTAPEDVAARPFQVVLPSATWTNSMYLAKQLIQMDAVAIKLPEYFHQTALIEQPFGLVLVSVGEAVKRLISVREAARLLGVKLSIFACTDARKAIAINSGKDSRDRQYLSGMTSFGDFHAYCGGLDAAISRALIYAPHADVVCFKSARPDISEAKRFSTAIRAACPDKQLAFDYSPQPDGPRWNEIDHTAFESKLCSVGFDYYFFTQFGAAIFPHFPSVSCWTMLDDVLRMRLPALEI